MTNDELKKKIIDILTEIATVIGDVESLEKTDASKEQSSIDYYNEMREWKAKYKAAEHRAEVAERALERTVVELLLAWGYSALMAVIRAKEFFIPEAIKEAEKELSEDEE